MTVCRDWGISLTDWEHLPADDREWYLAHLWATRDPRTPEQRREDERRARLDALRRKAGGR